MILILYIIVYNNIVFCTLSTHTYSVFLFFLPQYFFLWYSIVLYFIVFNCIVYTGCYDNLISLRGWIKYSIYLSILKHNMSGALKCLICMCSYNLCLIPSSLSLQPSGSGWQQSPAALMSPHQCFTGIQTLGEEEPEAFSTSAAGGASTAGSESFFFNWTANHIVIDVYVIKYINWEILLCVAV